MRVLPYRHALAQGPGLAALARLAAATVRRPAAVAVEPPGPWLRRTVEAPGRALVRDYLLENGGAPGDWAGEVPPHLFAQFGLPLAMQVIATLPYPVQRTLNAGCAWVKRAPLPANVPLEVRARLEALDADDARVKATVKIVASGGGAVDALEAEMRVFIPRSRPRRRPRGARGRGEPGAATRRDPATIPAHAVLLRRLHVGLDAGALFAALTGDFNPIHWLWPAAWAAGFPRPILQGFAMHARAVEAVGAALPGGVRSLRGVDVKFARPLPMPADVGIYAEGGHFWLGKAPGGPANLIGTCVPEDER